MAGVSDLREMLHGMAPVLAGEPYGIWVQAEAPEMAGSLRWWPRRKG